MEEKHCVEIDGSVYHEAAEGTRGGMRQTSEREIWVDNVKVVACVLVVLGHLLQSMTKPGILSDNDLYRWFEQTIYYFHVPLFFICSGYLYQKRSRVDSLKSWGRNVLKKAISLGVPYFTFSFATWLLKTAFSGAVNDEIGGIIDTLFIHPTSPYWYLYALFFIFIITPTFGNKKTALTGLTLAVALKLLGNIWGGYSISAVSYIFSDEIWFVIGMCMSVWEVPKKTERIPVIVPVITGMVFTAGSVYVYAADVANGVTVFALGLIACYSVVVLIMTIFRNGRQTKVFGYLAHYTMPIFLMHTLCAAPCRVLLLKLGMTSPIVHVCFGIVISFAGPIIAMKVLEKLKLGFLVYPGRLTGKRKK